MLTNFLSVVIMTITFRQRQLFCTTKLSHMRKPWRSREPRDVSDNFEMSHVFFFVKKNNFSIFRLVIVAEKLSPKKQQTTYQIITDDHTKNKVGKTVAISASNIIEESFVNATSNDIFTTFEEVTDDMKQSTLLNQGSNIEVISSTPIAAQSNSRKQDEFDIFGNFVAEVMRNMAKPKSRILQMNVMKLIAEAESDS